jgi:hypothetical protein
VVQGLVSIDCYCASVVQGLVSVDCYCASIRVGVGGTPMARFRG